MWKKFQKKSVNRLPGSIHLRGLIHAQRIIFFVMLVPSTILVSMMILLLPFTKYGYMTYYGCMSGSQSLSTACSRYVSFYVNFHTIMDMIAAVTDFFCVILIGLWLISPLMLRRCNQLASQLSHATDDEAGSLLERDFEERFRKELQSMPHGRFVASEIIILNSLNPSATLLCLQAAETLYTKSSETPPGFMKWLRRLSRGKGAGGKDARVRQKASELYERLNQYTAEDVLLRAAQEQSSKKLLLRIPQSTETSVLVRPAEEQGLAEKTGLGDKLQEAQTDIVQERSKP